MENIDINLFNLKTASELLRAITHQMRMRIIDLLINHGELHVQEIYTRLQLDQSIVSQQLRILKDNNVVNARRDGKLIYYTVNIDTIQKIKIAVETFDTITKERVKKKKEALRRELLS